MRESRRVWRRVSRIRIRLASAALTADAWNDAMDTLSAVTALVALAYAARLFYKLRGGRSPQRPNI